LNFFYIYPDFDVSKSTSRLLFVTQYGQEIPTNFAQEIYNRITRSIESAKDLTMNRASNFDIRFADFLYENLTLSIEQELAQVAIENPKIDISLLRQLIDGLFMMRAKRENISAGTNNLFNVSLKNFSCWQEYPGHGYVELKQGYKPLIDAIIKPHEVAFKSKLKLRHYMKRIHLCLSLDTENSQMYEHTKCVHCQFSTDPTKAVIRMCDDSGPRPVDFFVVCEKVICTMSLGYLKENLNLLFEPIGLVKSERRLAVQRLGFGTINKIFLFYSEPFWNESLDLIHLVWLPEDENFQLDRLIHRNSNRRVWTEDICKVEVCRGCPSALCLWIAGCEFFEELDDEKVSFECTKLLRRFLNSYSIPEPISIER